MRTEKNDKYIILLVFYISDYQIYQYSSIFFFMTLEKLFTKLIYVRKWHGHEWWWNFNVKKRCNSVHKYHSNPSDKGTYLLTVLRQILTKTSNGKKNGVVTLLHVLAHKIMTL